MSKEEFGKGILPAQYDWIMSPSGIHCYRGTHHRCTILPFAETTEELLFHDAVLKKASQEINAIVNKIITDNKDNKRSLALIEYQNRHMLVWTIVEDLVGARDDDAEVRNALKLKE